MSSDLLYQIALTLVPGVGALTAKKLIAYTGGAQAVFEASDKALLAIPDIGPALVQQLQEGRTPDIIDRARRELAYLDKNGFRALSFLADDYPRRLKQCEDSPVVLYTDGHTDLNPTHVVSIVGTRQATPYGKQLCDQLMQQFVELGYRPLVVSGLAFGIDIAAHRAALTHGLPTVAVVGHGLDMTYPAMHRSTRQEMVHAGGAVLTDFISYCKMDASNFVRRNRIVAGMADATIVVESAAKGGSLITAQMAFDYNRDVLAVPGRVGDPMSAGCLKLIKSNRASVIEHASDVAYLLGWDVAKQKPAKQLSLFAPELSPEEQRIAEALRGTDGLSIDLICRTTQLPMPLVSASLLNMEFGGLVTPLPGKVYALKVGG